MRELPLQVVVTDANYVSPEDEKRGILASMTHWLSQFQPLRSNCHGSRFIEAVLATTKSARHKFLSSPRTFTSGVPRPRPNWVVTLYTVAVMECEESLPWRPLLCGSSQPGLGVFLLPWSHSTRIPLGMGITPQLPQQSLHIGLEGGDSWPLVRHGTATATAFIALEEHEEECQKDQDQSQGKGKQQFTAGCQPYPPARLFG